MGDMSHLAANSPLDLEQLRTRLERMTNAELLRFGQAARFMCTPQANIGKLPRPEFVIQLEEAREEWRRPVDERKASRSLWVGFGSVHIDGIISPTEVTGEFH